MFSFDDKQCGQATYPDLFAMYYALTHNSSKHNYYGNCSIA